MESKSPYTHFTDVLEDGDGSLLVIDTGGWFLYGCPTSSIERPEVKGAIYRIRRQGAAPAPPDPYGLEIDLQGNPDRQWAQYLDDSRFKVRDRVIQAFGAHRENAIPTLASAVQESHSAQARRNAIWALTRIDSSTAREAVRTGLNDLDASVRLTAARSISTWRDREALTRLLVMVTTETSPIRRECATALGRIGEPSAIPFLLKSLETAALQPFLEHALIYALIELDEPAITRVGLRSSNPNVQRGSLIALDQMREGRLIAEQLAPFLAADDRPLRTQAVRIATRRQWSGLMIPQLKSALAEPNPDALQHLSEVLLAFGQDAKIQKLISDSLQRAGDCREGTPVFNQDTNPCGRFFPNTAPPWVHSGCASFWNPRESSFPLGKPRCRGDWPRSMDPRN